MVNDKGEQEVIGKALDEWQRTGLISETQAAQLRATVVIRQSERQQLAHYFFIIAIACSLLAFGALFLDEKLLEKLQRTFLLQNLTIGIGATLLAVVCFWQARKRKPGVSETTFELYLIPGGLTTLIALVYFCKDVGDGDSYSLLLGLSTLAFAALSYGFRSAVLWVIFLLSVMGWYGVFSYNYNTDYLFLGMNYPVRFTAFGAVILLLSLLQQHISRIAHLRQLTFHAGLLIFLTGMWGVSVFGNYAHLDEWQAVRQTKVLAFAIISALFTGGILYYGIRRDNRAARDYGILFLLINLYTRYFEYFWEALSKGLSFLILALSFGLLGWWLSRRKNAVPGKNDVKKELSGKQS